MSEYWFAGAAVRPGRPDLTRVLSNLMIGEYPTPADIDWLRGDHGVTAVLSLQDDADLASKNLRLHELETGYRTCQLEFHRIAVPDGNYTVFAERLDAIVDLLRDLIERGNQVYLHCNAGMNRAPTVAIAYLHLHHDLSLAQARDFVKRLRSCVPYMQLLEERYGGAQRKKQKAAVKGQESN